jgi:mono/diheme cytochrome c family protein
MVFILAACHSKKKVASSTKVDNVATPQETQAPPQQTTAASNDAAQMVKAGASLYVQHCKTCHELKDPTGQTPERWKQIVPEMSRMANEKTPNSIDAKTQQSILAYLLAMSEKK